MSTIAEREVEICIELGRTTLTADSLKELGRGSTIRLESATGDPVDVYADGELVARGELLLRDECFFIRVIELVRQRPVS